MHVHARMRGRLRTQLILLCVKSGEIRNPPRAPEPSCSTSTVRRGRDVWALESGLTPAPLSLTLGCWQPASLPLHRRLPPVPHPCAGGEVELPFCRAER